MTTMAMDLAYQLFVDEVRPVALYLTSCSATLNRNTFWRVFDDEERARSAKNKITVVCSARDVQLDRFDVEAKATFAVISKVSEELLTVSCVFDMHFESPVVSSEHVRQFALEDARLVVWPYVREFISSMTSRMGIPPVATPLALGRYDKGAQ